MSITPAGVGTKKETVYGGPGTQPSVGGTVYNGPGLSGTATYPAAPVRPAQRQAGAARGGNVFFVIAAFSAINAVLILAKAPIVFALGLAITRVSADSPLGAVLVLNALAIGAFVTLGIFASRGAKAAFVIGLLLYAGDTAVLLLSVNPALHIISIVCHGIFLFSIFKGLRQLS
jgi:Na+/melibiose symporter-like transporter